MTDSLAGLSRELDRMAADGLIRVRRRVASLAGGWCELDGRRLRDFASNDYLDLAHDGRLVEAAGSALEESGIGARASVLVTGRSEWHERLEERLATFEGQEAAIVFPTGYAANVGSICALGGRDDVLFCDRLNHASLVDGCRLSGARLRVYRHERLDRLQRELKRAGSFRRRMIVTDGVFSMDGKLAPLPELCELAGRYDAALLVDEAHATGVFGERGRGTCELLGVEDGVAVRAGTLSKAVGCLGGFVAGRRELIDWLFNAARTQMFSTALPPAICAAACRALEIIDLEPDRREKLRNLSGRLRARLREIGARVPEGSVGPIVAVLLGAPKTAVRAAAHVESAGFLVAAIRPPTVPRGTSRLRISLSCAHTAEDVDRLAEAISEVLPKNF